MQNDTSVQPVKENQDLYSNVNGYLSTFSIHRNKYIYKNNEKWITVDKYLKTAIALKHIQGQAVIGGYLSYSTDAFCFDIDDHRQDREKELYGNIKILSAYNLLIKHFGIPSIVFRSSGSGGLHCWYKLQSQFPFVVIKQGVNASLRKIPRGIDFLPTPDHALRLPFAIKEGGMILDNLTLKPVENITAEGLIELLNTIEKKHFIEVFNCNPSRFLLKAKTKKKQFKNFQALQKFEVLESQLFPIVEHDGSRNSNLEKLSFAYYCAGMDIAEATDRITGNMTGTGKEYKARRVEQQITAHYKRYQKKTVRNEYKNKAVHHDLQLDLFLQSKIDAVVESSTFTDVRRKKSLTHFLSEMYNWKGYIEGLSKSDRTYLDFLYPYFRYNTKNRGLIPLPSTLLYGWNFRYFEFMEYLINQGIISKEQNYSTDLGVCNYYNINTL